MNTLDQQWAVSPRWVGVKRRHTGEDVARLQGSVRIEHTLARRGAQRLWALLNETEPVTALGCLTGNQAVQAVKAGLKAIYLSGWQVAADANLAGQMYPDQSLYPVNSVPNVVERINNALARADRHRLQRGPHRDGVVRPNSSPTPKPASGDRSNVFELMKSMIRAGAAGVHFEDQLASEKKCGHMGGKVLDSNATSRSPSVRRALGRRCARCADDHRCPHRRQRRCTPHK